jgi:hypothetical protein
MPLADYLIRVGRSNITTAVPPMTIDRDLD